MVTKKALAKYHAAMRALDVEAALAALGVEDLGYTIHYTVRDVVIGGRFWFPADTRVLAVEDEMSPDGWPLVYIVTEEGTRLHTDARMVVEAFDFIQDPEPETFYTLRFVEDKSFFRSIRKDRLYVAEEARDSKRFATKEAAVLYGGKVFKEFGYDMNVVKVVLETMEVDGSIRSVGRIGKKVQK